MARRIASLFVLLAFVVGVPILLLRITGLPVVDDLPDLKGLKEAIELRWVPLEWVVAILALAAWILWAYLALAVSVRIAGHAELRLRTAGRVWAASETFTWSPVKVIVDLALGAALVTSVITSGSARAAVSRTPGWSSVIAPQVDAVRAEPSSPSSSNGAAKRLRIERSSQETPHRPQRGRHASINNYVVRPGDSLWSIAEDKLKDPYRWKEIWSLNRGRAVAEGERLSTPGFIRPGWNLCLPEIPSSKPDRHELCDNGHGGGRPHQSTEEDEGGVTLETPATPTAPSSGPAAGSRPEVRHETRVEIPSGSAVAVGFIAGLLSALGIERLLRRRRREPQPPSSGWPPTSARKDLKARLVRAMESDENNHSSEDITQVLKRLNTPAAEIVLGHRNGKAVVARRRGHVYTFAGEQDGVLSYLRDLALHSAIAHRGDIEVWTTQELELPRLPGLRIFTNARALVSEMEIEILKRHRMFDEEGSGTWEAHQKAWPDDPLALLLGVTPLLEESVRNRFQAVATQGRELGIMVAASGAEGASIRVEEHTLRPPHSAELELGEQPFDAIHISDADRMELLHTLSDTGSDPAEQEPSSEVQSAPDQSPDTHSPVQVRLFGRPAITGVDEQSADGFGPKSREFLFFFLLNPEGVSREEAFETLWPGTETEQGIQRFKFQLRKVRLHLRGDQAPTAKFIDKSGAVYRPVPELFSVDVWEFDRHMRDASRDASETTLSAAVDLYRGELLQGVYYEWAEPLQSHFKRRYLDVLVKLSDLRSTSADFEGALSAVLQAIEEDPYAEQLYRRALTLCGRLRRPTEIRRIYKELEATLAQGLEAEPDKETADLKDRLLEQLSEPV